VVDAIFDWLFEAVGDDDEDELTFVRRTEREQEERAEAARRAAIEAREAALAGPISSPRPAQPQRGGGD
jgi:hypothetical protein